MDFFCFSTRIQKQNALFNGFHKWSGNYICTWTRSSLSSVESTPGSGKDRCVLLQKVRLCAVGRIVNSRCFESAGWFSAPSLRDILRLYGRRLCSDEARGRLPPKMPKRFIDYFVLFFIFFNDSLHSVLFCISFRCAAGTVVRQSHTLQSDPPCISCAHLTTYIVYGLFCIKITWETAGARSTLWPSSLCPPESRK